jgi:hypothetical protein
MDNKVVATDTNELNKINIYSWNKLCHGEMKLVNSCCNVFANGLAQYNIQTIVSLHFELQTKIRFEWRENIYTQIIQNKKIKKN